MENKNVRHDAADYLVYIILFVSGALAFLCYRRTADFIGEDVFFADCARSLLKHGFYGIDGRPETTQPPGLSAILAALFIVFGYGHAICLKAMAVFETLGFCSAYALLRRHMARTIAASICLLLMTSPVLFTLATQEVLPAYPLFFSTITALLIFEKFGRASSLLHRLLWGIGLSLLIVASLMIASAALALLGSIVIATLMTFVTDRQAAIVRLKMLAPVFVISLSAQAMWMLQKPAPLEWRLPGYPASYWNQLEVKKGNFPELGLARLSDIPQRIAENVVAQTDSIAQIALRHGINGSRIWVLVIPGLLAAAGWIYSIWQTKGTSPIEWYFAAYGFIYLMWPWNFELRFLIPIAPLICFYAWRGIRAIYEAALSNPRVFGFGGLPVGLFLGIAGIHDSRPRGFPEALIALLWILFAACSLRMIQTGRPLSLLHPARMDKWLRSPIGSWSVTPWRICVQLGWALVVVLLVTGVTLQVGVAQRNIRTPEQALANDLSQNPMALELESARWIRSHTSSSSVVMARHLPIVSHYAERRMVWFAPISDPEALLSGIINHKVDYIIVIKHRAPYYLPDDDLCFDPMLAKYVNSFQLVFRDSNLRIYHVDQSGHITIAEKGWNNVQS
jgi:hypothetical protein